MTETIRKLLTTEDWGVYQPLMEEFRESESYALLMEILEKLNHSALFESAIHGVGHIERTLVHGAMCAREEGLSAEDSRTLLYACAYHDVGRQNDGPDDLHGWRSAQRLGELTPCTGEELKRMQAAVDAHSRRDEVLRETVEGYHPADLDRALTIAELLKDADGLDRVRIWDLDPAYLRREDSRRRASFAMELYQRYQRAEGRPIVPEFVRRWKHLDEFGNSL